MYRLSHFRKNEQKSWNKVLTTLVLQMLLLKAKLNVVLKRGYVTILRLKQASGGIITGTHYLVAKW